MLLSQEPYTSAHDIDEDLTPEDIDDETIIAARTFLEKAVGRNHDWNDPHFARTPVRFAKMIREMTSEEPFDFTTFPSNGNDEMVIVDNISFVALCAHHVVPFIGVAHIAYIPNERLVGLSKIARTVRWWAKDLWVQEQLTSEIADYLQDNLEPKGIAVVMQATHQCMTLRGVKAEGSLTTTSKMTGVFLDPTKQARTEFLSLIRKV